MSANALVGRARQLTVLREALTRAVAGEGGVVVVRGDPGIGKSMLVEAALDGVDVTRFVGSAVPGGRPGRAISAIAVAALAAGANLDDSGVALFRRPLESLIGAGSADPDLVANPAVFGSLGATIGEGLLRLLVAAADRPVAVLDDLHWADADTHDVVEYVADHVHGRPVAVVVIHRVGENRETDALTVRVGRDRRSTTVDVSLCRTPPSTR